MNLSALVMPEGEYRVIRCDIADRLLASVDGNAALLYLYILRHGGKISNEQAMRALQMRTDIFERALFTLTNLMIATEPVSPSIAPSKPKYTASELKDARGLDNDFSQLCDIAESILGKPLTESFLRTLFTVHDHLKLPTDVILELLSYLKQQNGILKARDVEREATIWLDRGVLTFQDAQTHLARLEAERPLVNALLLALGIVGRAPSPAEKSIAELCVEKGFGAEALTLACARMNKQISQPSMSYLRKILKSWDAKNIHTLAEITAVEPELASTPVPVTITTPPDESKLDAWEIAWLEEVEQRKRAQAAQTEEQA